jgi:hypothetical protein
LYQAYNGHDPAFERATGKEHNNTQHTMPEGPEQETTLLPFPEAGKQIFAG